tara:strand:- start:10253 stop:10528 length:276 start_codon:yes stop_codon:yes gene_type:complete
MIKNMQIIVTGNVQGVGFRAFIRNRALKNDICGWVRNLDDGSVEALLSGSQENLDKLIPIIKNGTPWSKVSDVRIDFVDIDDDLTSFEITN